MNLKHSLISIFFLFISISFYGQNNLTISGKVVDAQTNENLAFVNIGIEGTLIGTASNSEGEFSFNIPGSLADKNLYFSTIGYENYIVPVKQFTLNSISTVSLQPQTYGIENINVNTKSKVLYRIIRNATNNIPSKFVHQPYSMKALYQQEEYSNQTLTRKRDALVLITDAKGYGNPKNAFKARNYKFMKVQRNFDVKNLESGMTFMDDLLTFDIARSPENILDVDFLNGVELDMLQASTINMDSVWVIAFRNPAPNISQSGDFYPKIYEGKLYISKDQNLLLSTEIHIVSAKANIHGRSIAVEKPANVNDVDYKVVTNYMKTSNGLLLDKIVMTKSYSDINKKAVKIEASLQIVENNVPDTNMLKERQYFEKLDSDPNFWTDLKY